MTLALSLLVLGIILLGLELLLPSAGVLTVLGIASVLGWIVASFLYGGLMAGALAILITAVLLPILLVVAVRWWPRTFVGRAVLIGDAPHARPRPYADRVQLVGRRGVTVSRMLPSGAIEVDGHTYDAITEGMPLEPGVEIYVSSVQGNSLIVTTAPPHGARDRNDATQRNDRAADPRDDVDPAGRGEQPLDQWVPDPFDDTLG